MAASVKPTEILLILSNMRVSDSGLGYCQLLLSKWSCKQSCINSSGINYWQQSHM